MKKFKLKGVAFKRKRRLEELRQQFNLCISGKCDHGHYPGNPLAMADDGTVIEYTDPFVPVVSFYKPKDNEINGQEAKQVIIDDPFGPGVNWTAEAML